jgi:hypothetical protein
MGAGLVGWLIFMLACVGGPAWSPDGSKILFAWRDFDGGRFNVAVYDRATHQSRIIFQHREARSDRSDFNVAPAWQNDGTRAIVAMTTPDKDDAHCTLLSIAMKGTAPPEAYELGCKTVCFGPAFMPQIGTRVYVGTGEGIAWLDLATGDSDSKTIQDKTGFENGEGHLSEHNGRLVFTRTVSRPISDPENKDAKEDGVEFGRIQLDGLDPRPAFTLWPSEVADVDINALAVWEPGGSRIAMVGTAKDGDQILLLDENKGLTGKLMPELGGVKEYRLGNPEWSHDGKTLFAAAITKGQGDETYDYSLAEIPLAGGAGKLTRLASFHVKKHEPEGQPDAEASSLSDFDYNVDRGDLPLSMAVSLSPDGGTIAATPANMGHDCQFAAADRALFLADMRGQARRVTRIPFPKTPKASPQPAGTAK